MVWWLAAAASTFYLLFSNTASSQLRGDEEVDVPVGGDGGEEEEAPPERQGKGARIETAVQFAGQGYDPAKNPFRQAPSQTPPAGQSALDEPGVEEVPADEELPLDGDFGDPEDRKSVV